MGGNEQLGAFAGGAALLGELGKESRMEEVLGLFDPDELLSRTGHP